MDHIQIKQNKRKMYSLLDIDYFSINLFQTLISAPNIAWLNTSRRIWKMRTVHVGVLMVWDTIAMKLILNEKKGENKDWIYLA
jgi:hypothetical protein